MATQAKRQYDSPHQFEPLMPGAPAIGGLLERASDLTRAAGSLTSSAAQATSVELRQLLRAMNSYYTNRMEGDHTRPSDIERALADDFSANADLARKQRLAVLHMAAERDCEQVLDYSGLDDNEIVRGLYESGSLIWLHYELFSQLPESDLRIAGSGRLQPGTLRERPVKVGIHEAPTPESIDGFLVRWSEVYGGVRRGEASIVAAAAAHHRLTWVHPFLDGNGRVARLHTHLLFHSMGLTNGLWSPLRGFARSQDRYMALLQAADEPRRGDYDGRGNLTQSGLVDWIRYVLDTCIDQIEFMSRQLDVRAMRDRLSAALLFEESVVKSGVRTQALVPLHYLFATQDDLGRADFKTMTGLGERVATEMLSSLVARGFLKSDTPYGNLRFAIPRHALRFYFPALWPEAEQDEALLESERRSGRTAG